MVEVCVLYRIVCVPYRNFRMMYTPCLVLLSVMHLYCSVRSIHYLHFLLWQLLVALNYWALEIWPVRQKN